MCGHCFTEATGVNVRAALLLLRALRCVLPVGRSDASPALPQRLVGSTVVQNRIPALSASQGALLGLLPEFELASQRTSIVIRKLSFTATGLEAEVD